MNDLLAITAIIAIGFITAIAIIGLIWVAVILFSDKIDKDINQLDKDTIWKEK
jgi:uncharacterized membrane protein YciS (DUF1049 family)